MAPTRSIVRRLVLLLTAAMALLWLAGSAAAILTMRHELDEAFDSALQETAQRLLPLAVDDLFEHDDDDGPEGRTLAGSGMADHEEKLTYQVLDRQGRILLRSHDAPAEPYGAARRHGFAEAGPWRVYTEGTISDSLFIQVAEPLAHRHEALWESAANLLLPLLLLLPLAGLAVWWAVRRELRPVDTLRRAIGARDGSHLAPIGTASLPAELRPIAEDVDRLLDRLRTALDAERGFAANSAHELRTPIAAALAQTQRLKAEAPAGPLAERAARVEASLRRLSGMAEKLLQLSRADAGIPRPEEPQDLLPVLGLVLQDLAAAGQPVDRIAVDAGGLPALARPMDLDAFALALRNLAENALRHGAPDAPVRITVAGDGSIHVINGGPVLPAEFRRRATQRFARGPETGGKPGTGLGLAIVERVMEQAGGRLELRSPATGQDDGFEAILHLPAAS